MSSQFQLIPSAGSHLAYYDTEEYSVFNFVSEERELASNVIDSLFKCQNLQSRSNLVIALKELQKTILDSHDEYQQPIESQLLYGDQLSILVHLNQLMKEHSITTEQLDAVLANLVTQKIVNATSQALTLSNVLIALEFSLLGMDYCLPSELASELVNCPFTANQTSAVTVESTLKSPQVLLLETSSSCYKQCRTTNSLQPFADMTFQFALQEKTHLSPTEYEAIYSSLRYLHNEKNLTALVLHSELIKLLVKLGRFQFHQEDLQTVIKLAPYGQTKLVCTQQLDFYVQEQEKNFYRPLTITDLKKVDVSSLPQHQRVAVEYQALLGSNIQAHFDYIVTCSNQKSPTLSRPTRSLYAVALKKRLQTDENRTLELVKMLEKAKSSEVVTFLADCCTADEFNSMLPKIICKLEEIGALKQKLPQKLIEILNRNLLCLDSAQKNKAVQLLFEKAQCWEVVVYAIESLEKSARKEFHLKAFERFQEWQLFSSPLPEKLRSYLTQNLGDKLYNLEMLSKAVNSSTDREAILFLISNTKANQEQIRELKLVALEILEKLKKLLPISDLFLRTELYQHIPIETLKVFPETTRINELWKALKEKETQSVLQLLKTGLNPNVSRACPNKECLYTDDVVSKSKAAQKIKYRWDSVPLLIEATRQNNIELVRFLVKHPSTNLTVRMPVNYVGHHWNALDIALNGHFDEIRDLICKARGVERACELERYQDMNNCTIL